MTIHETIKSQIIDAMRAHDQVKLDVLRGLSTLFTNELLAKPAKPVKGKNSEAAFPFIDDESATALIKRSVKQRKDSIEQFEKGGRKDLVKKEQAELKILETYLTPSMSRADIKKAAEKMMAAKKFDKSEKSAVGKLVGELMRELKGKADGADVKAVVDELVK